MPSRPIVALQAGCNLKINGSASISITLVVDTGRAVLVRLAYGFASLHSHFIPGGTIYDVIESLSMIPGPGLRHGCWHY